MKCGKCGLDLVNNTVEKSMPGAAVVMTLVAVTDEEDYDRVEDVEIYCLKCVPQETRSAI